MKREPDYSVSRRDFMKIASYGISSVTLLNEVGKLFRKESDALYVDSMLGLLTRTEEAPSSMQIELPNQNENFRLPHQILSESFEEYEAWRKSGLVENELYVSVSPVYIGKTDLTNMLAKNFVDSSRYFLNRLEKKENIHYLISQVANMSEGNLMSDVLQKEIVGCRPIHFSEGDILNIEYLMENDPGSGIVSKLRNMKGDVLDNYKKLSHTIWDWVASDNKKTSKPMTFSRFLAAEYALNQGDVRRGLWDAAIDTRLKTRNSDKDYHFIDVENPNKEDMLDLRNSLKFFNENILDPFSLRISSNWSYQNVGLDNKSIYTVKGNQENHGYAWKPLDVHCASGNISHGANILALSTVIDPQFIPGMILREHSMFFNRYGIEKLVADFTVASHSDRTADMLNMLNF